MKRSLKRSFALSLSLALLAAVTVCGTSIGGTFVSGSLGSNDGPVSISFFYDSLSPYGQWFQDPSYGWCWTPYDVSADWRPYSEGHWEYTDYGWCWASDEPWGWAAYHYGRWFFDDTYGWVWVPGTEWAPAWVAWRYGDDWVGWAPLPPAAGWDVSAGLTFGDFDAIPRYEWCFVPERHVLDVRLRPQVAGVARNVTLFERSHNATRYESRNGRPYDVGPDAGQVGRYVGRPVQRVRIVDAGKPSNGRGQSVGRGGVAFFRPAVRRDASGQVAVPVTANRRSAIPDGVLQRQREEQQRRLESDLRAERARLDRDQRNELRTQRQRPAIEEIRRRQAVEQQAFNDHANLQRRVLEQRIQRQIVRPVMPGKTRNQPVRRKGQSGR